MAEVEYPHGVVALQSKVKRLEEELESERESARTRFERNVQLNRLLADTKEQLFSAREAISELQNRFIELKRELRNRDIDAHETISGLQNQITELEREKSGEIKDEAFDKATRLQVKLIAESKDGPGYYLAKDRDPDTVETMIIQVTEDGECVDARGVQYGSFTPKGLMSLELGPKVPEELADVLCNMLQWLEEEIDDVRQLASSR